MHKIYMSEVQERDVTRIYHLTNASFYLVLKVRKSSESTKFTRERWRKVGRGEQDLRPQFDNYGIENQNMKGKET